MTLKEIFKNNRLFFIPYLILLFILLSPFILSNKSAVHLCINSYHSRPADWFFKYFTILGDGYFAVCIVFVFLLISYRKSVLILLSFITGGVAVQIIKRFTFSENLRPVKFFNGISDLYLVEGVKMRQYLSFPSGHSATAFSLFLCLAFFSKNNTVKFFCFTGATLVAFSRVYLSQHFLIDVYVGSMIGVISAILFYKWIYFTDKKWMDRGLIRST